MRKFLMLALLCLALPASAAVLATDDRALEARFAEDLTRVDAWRSFQSTLLVELERLMLRSDGAPLTAPEQARLQRLWGGIIDLQLALDVVDRRWRDRSNLREGSIERGVVTSYSAWLARTAGAVTLLRLGRAHPELQRYLDEPMPQLGLPAGTWSRIAQNVESASTATEFLAFGTLHAAALASHRVPASPSVDEDAGKIRGWLRDRDVAESAANANRLMATNPATALNTITAMGSPWFGSAHFYRRSRPLIGEAWLRRVLPLIQPADIILIRHEWDPADPGHQSFWGQAAIWVGTPSARRHYFADAATLAAIRGEGYEDLDALLRARSPSAYGMSLTPGPDAMRAVATTPLGVTLGGAALLEADSIAVIRLRRSSLDRARVVQRAFEMVGRPFDVAGNVDESSSVGNAELVLRALGDDAPRLSQTRAGLDDIVDWIDSNGGIENPIFELVVFLDGDETTRNASLAEFPAFSSSWAHPVWRTWFAASAFGQRR